MAPTSSGTWGGSWYEFENGTMVKTIDVVGIGASAGGLRSLQQLFDNLEPDLGAAFVVIQHLSPDHESMMRSLLAKHTSMPVEQVRERIVVEPNRVYLISRNTELELRGNELLPLPRNPDEVPSLPINRFFVSLAMEREERGIAVVLSGTGSDGTLGIGAIKAQGGLVIAESEASAQFAGMPASAEQSGFVDRVAGADEIGALLAARLRDQPLPSESSDHGAADQRLLRQMLEELEQEAIADFSGYRERTMLNRVSRRMRHHELSTMADYLDLLRSDEAEKELLAQDLLIGVTRFFRDEECFEGLRKHVLPKLLERADPVDGIRIWCAGCASGEEAYSLGMLLLEEIEKQGETLPVKIFATDVHRRSLEHALAGEYDLNRLQGVSAERLDRFFVLREGRYVVKRELRELIVFSFHDVVVNPPFTRLDLIVCRNLLIYLKNLTQKRVRGYFHFGLKKEGYLFLGPSEAIISEGSGFRPINEKCRLFQRVDAPLRPRLDLTAEVRSSSARLQPTPIERAPSRTRSDSWFSVYDRLLDRFMPPSYLLDDDFVVIDCYGGAENYLTLASRRPTGRITELLSTPASAALAGALKRCARTDSSVTISAVRLDHRDHGAIQAAVTVESLKPSELLERKFLVSIRTSETSAEPNVTPNAQTDPSDQNGVAALLSELESTRESLRATIEESDLNSEQLHAANEELVAANEEMQSTNEELNSVNEELHTVNSEYQRKNAELIELHRDMVHLLENADIGTIFLGPELEIRRFSPDMKSIFNFTESDIGRKLSSFTHHLDLEGLPGKLEDVRRTGNQAEFQVSDDAGTPKLLRLTPSVEEDDVVAILLTLVDIGDIVAAQRATERERSRLQGLVDSLPIMVAQVSADGRYSMVNRAYADYFGREKSDLVGKGLREILGLVRYERIESKVERALAGESQSFELHSGDDEADGDTVFLTYYEPIRLASGGANGFYIAAIDITTLRNVNRELIEARLQAESADRAKSTFLANMSHEIRTPMAAILGHIELLEREEEVEKIRSSVQVVRKNGEHLLALINDILHLSALDLGDPKLDLGPMRPAELIDEVASLLEPRAEERGIEMKAIVMDTVPDAIQSDPRRLRQILMNLVSNAIKFTDDGTVRLTADIEGSDVVFQVEDSGRGIAPEQMERLFQPFEQLDASSARDAGTGLGLSISARLAQHLGGYLEVKSESGVGSTFTLRVPYAPATIAPSSAASEAEHHLDDYQIPAGTRVLVVDDNEDARELTRIFLEDFGAEVDEAQGGVEALQKARAAAKEKAYSLIFLDIHMPDLSGLEVVREIRSDGDHTPVIALTAGALRRDRLEALDAGCTDHVAKPATQSTLAEVTERWLGQKHPEERDRTVLLVDDDKSTRDGLRDLLELEDFDVLTAGGYQGALRASESRVFDVVITDITLDDGNGGELARELKARPGYSTSLFVAVSGWSEQERPDEATAFDQWLQKPVKLDHLLQLLRENRR